LFSRVTHTGAVSRLTSSKKNGNRRPKPVNLDLKVVVLASQACFCIPRPEKIGCLPHQRAVQMAPLNELGAVEVQAPDVEPTPCGEPDHPALSGLLDVPGGVIAPRVKESETLRRSRRRCVVAFEAVAGGTSVDEVLDVVRPSRGLWVEVVDLQFAADR
jgi:hypothetical protein